jgi:aspartate ammonia-lyase
MESVQLLANGIRLFTDRCLSGVTVNEAQCARYAASSLALSTVVAVLEGYPLAGKIAREAAERGCSVRELVVGKKMMSGEEAARLFDPMAMTDIVAFENIVAGKK